MNLDIYTLTSVNVLLLMDLHYGVFGYLPGYIQCLLFSCDSDRLAKIFFPFEIFL